MNLVCTGACTKCTFGIAPSTLTILPSKMVNCEKKPAATIADYIPILNIAPFGMCISPANPMVISIIAASLGTVTQAPCIPAVITPWMVGKPNVLIGKLPALNATSTAMCMWGGMISISFPGQVSVKV